MQVEHEVHQGALELGAEIPVESEAGAGDLGGAFQVEDAELLAELPVRLGGEIECGRRAPALDFDVGVLVVADGDGVVRKVGNAGQNVVELAVGGLGPALRARECLLELEHLGGRALQFGLLLRSDGAFFLGSHERADFFAQLVAAGERGLQFAGDGAAARFDLAEIAEDLLGVGAAAAQLLFDYG